MQIKASANLKTKRHVSKAVADVGADAKNNRKQHSGDKGTQQSRSKNALRQRMPRPGSIQNESFDEVVRFHGRSLRNALERERSAR